MESKLWKYLSLPLCIFRMNWLFEDVVVRSTVSKTSELFVEVVEWNESRYTEAV